MNALAATFLVAHGLVHVAIWLPVPAVTAPFDPRRSWLVHDRGAAIGGSTALALAIAAVDATAGISLAMGTGDATSLAVSGALLGLILKSLYFHPWLTIGIALDLAIVVVALS